VSFLGRKRKEEQPILINQSINQSIDRSIDHQAIDHQAIDNQSIHLELIVANNHAAGTSRY